MKTQEKEEIYEVNGRGCDWRRLWDGEWLEFMGSGEYEGGCEPV